MIVKKVRVLLIWGYFVSGGVFAYNEADLDLVRKSLELGKTVSAEGFDLSGADFSFKNFKSAKLAGTNMANANLTKANIEDADFLGAILNNAIFKEATLNSNTKGLENICRVSGLVLDRKLRDQFGCLSVYIERLKNHKECRVCNLDGSNLSGLDLKKVDLESASLVYADLTKADLSEANLRKADLSNAVLNDANWFETDLRDVVHTGREGVSSARASSGASERLIGSCSGCRRLLVLSVFAALILVLFVNGYKPSIVSMSDVFCILFVVIFGGGTLVLYVLGACASCYLGGGKLIESDFL